MVVAVTVLHFRIMPISGVIGMTVNSDEWLLFFYKKTEKELQFL